MTSWTRRWLLCGLMLLGPVAPLGAQTPAPDQFVPVAPGELLEGQEQIPAPRLVFGAYAVVWLVFFFYLLSLWSRVGKVESELRAVTEKLEHGGR